jgi:UDP-N-acetylglucosamine:LPS N-acetylglucosamine transferase
MTTGEYSAGQMRVLLVCSPGGHLQQMLALKPAWGEFDRAWATLPSADVEFLLEGEWVTLAHGPTNRSVKNLFRNLAVAWRLIRAHRPEAILSTGAGIAVPFFVVGKLLRVRLVYVESVTRTESISLSGRLLYPLANRFFTQWPESAERLRRAEYAGGIL